MKKVVSILLLLLILLLIRHSTYAVTTLFLGRSVSGNGINENVSPDPRLPKSNFSGKLDSGIIELDNITDFNKIKVDLDYENGNFNYNFPYSSSYGLWDLQIGYPVAKDDKAFFNVTLGAAGYSLYTEFVDARTITSCMMLGLDFVVIPSERVQFEINLQHSIFEGSASAKPWDGSNSLRDLKNPELTVIKLKLKYFFNDNWGLAVRYHQMKAQVDDFPQDLSELNSTVLGLVYRF